ncbi:MAG: hypothetical protein AAF411_08190 [Myxococcota bacterium]
MRIAPPSYALVGLLVAACGGEEAPAAPEPEAAELPAAEPSAEAPAEPEEEETPAEPSPGDSNFGTITLAPGFPEDPYRATGTSGGNRDASTLSDACAGFVTTPPDHLFVAQADFSVLRIMAKSEKDVTLVVQRPDGTYLCNDDWEGNSEGATHPLVSAHFPPGTYKIWVGSYEASEPGRYVLGVSELDTVTPASL